MILYILFYNWAPQELCVKVLVTLDKVLIVKCLSKLLTKMIQDERLLPTTGDRTSCEICS